MVEITVTDANQIPCIPKTITRLSFSFPTWVKTARWNFLWESSRLRPWIFHYVIMLCLSWPLRTLRSASKSSITDMAHFLRPIKLGWVLSGPLRFRVAAWQFFIKFRKAAREPRCGKGIIILKRCNSCTLLISLEGSSNTFCFVSSLKRTG